FVRSSVRLSMEHPKLTVVEGDGLDETAVSNAIQGHSAIVCCVGSKG
ncbi:NAD(P)-dependent oxidoreductase, partial [Halorubrum sp. Atlit-9R]